MVVLRFIDAESLLYEPPARNRLSAAAARAISCEWYVDEIFRRYSDAAATFNNTMRQLPGSTTMPDFGLLVNQSMRVHLEIESFYLFSKMQLDGIAQLLHWWFKDARSPDGEQLARGPPIQRHSEVVKNLAKLIEVAGLAFPEDLVKLAGELKRHVVDYRDRKVTHDQSHGFPGSLVSREGHVTIAKVQPGTSPESGEQPIPLIELNELRRRYSDSAMLFLAANRDIGTLCKLLLASRLDSSMP